MGKFPYVLKNSTNQGKKPQQFSKKMDVCDTKDVYGNFTEMRCNWF